MPPRTREQEAATETGTEDLAPFRLHKELDPIEANALNESAADSVAEIVAKLRNSLQTEYRVAADRVFIVGSSGLAAAPSRGVVEKKVNTATGGTMEFISADDEAKLVFKGILLQVPKSVREERLLEVVVLDIGSGNSRGAWISEPGTRTLSSFQMAYGTKSFAKEVDKGRGEKPFLSCVEKYGESQLLSAIKDANQKAPGLSSMKRYYMVGGASWALATLTHPEQINRAFVPLTSGDIAKFRRIVRTRPDEPLTFESTLPGTRPSKATLAAARKDFDAVTRKAFTRDQLIAASEILSRLDRELKLNKKTIRFARGGLYAWPIGYLARKMER
jgi:hypothetical protein